MKNKGAEHEGKLTPEEQLEVLQMKKELAQKTTPKYNELFNSIDQGFCTITLKYDENDRPVDYQFIEVSPSFEHQTGIKDAAGKLMRDIAPDHDEFWFETYGRIAKDRKSERFEYFSTPLNRWWSVYAFPINEEESKQIGVLFNDITEQVKAKKRLEESEMQFRNVLLQSPNIFVILKGFPQMIITFANEPLFKSWGRTAEIIGKPLLEALPELKEQLFPQLLQRVFETGETYRSSEEKAVIIKNGVAVDTYYVYVYQAIFDDNQKVTGVTIMATDITEQVIARRKIEASEKRFSKLLLESPFAVAILKGKDMLVALANDAIKSLWGKGAEVEGKPLLSLMPEIKEQGFAALLEKVYTTGKPFYGHEVLVKLQRNGIWEEVYFNFIYQPYKEADETISGVTIIANEVTTQAIANKKIAASEQNVSRLFMEAPAVICVFRGPQHVYELANEMYMQLIGKKDILGEPVRKLFPELEGQGYYELLDNVYATGEPFIGKEMPVKFNKGAEKLEEVYFNLVYQPFHNSEGEIDGILVHGVDVTEQVLSRKKIEESEARLEAELKDTKQLQKVSSLLIEADNIQLLYEQILDAAIAIMDANMASMQMFEEEKNGLLLLASKGFHPKSAEFWKWVDTASSSSCSKAITQGQRIIVPDVDESNFMQGTEDLKYSQLSGIKAVQSTPLITRQGKPVGMISTHWKKPYQPTERQLNLLDVLARQAADLIERRQAEEALRDAEEKYRNELELEVLQRTTELKENKDLLQTVFDASPNSISVFEILYNDAGAVYDFRILILNAFAKTSISGRNVIGQDYSEAFPHVVESGVLDEFIKAANTGERVDLEKWYHGEGFHHCFRLIANKIGNLLLVTAEDITARKNAEEGLKTNLTLLKQSEDLAQLGSWEYEIATGKFTWSDGMYELFGLPKGINVRPEIYLDHAVDEERYIAERILLGFKKPQAFDETLCIKRAGSVREIKIKASIVADEKGGSLKLVGVDLDITEAKQSEKTLREQAHFIQSTNEALPDILSVINIETNQIVYINHSFEERLGYTDEQIQNMNPPFFGILYQEDIAGVLAHFEEMKGASDGEVCEVEYRIKAADGSLHWFRDRNAVFKRDKAGVPIEKIGIAQDITERKKVEQELKESNISLRYANENLQQFASIASHDLQEPLRKIKLFTSVLEKNWTDLLPAEGKDIIRKITNASDRMSQLIREVLQYSKIAYGEKEFIPADLHQILQNVLSDLDLLLEDAGAAVDYPGPMPVIEAIPLQMHQLFYNLLTNAVKFRTKGEGLAIRISAGPVPGESLKRFPDSLPEKSYIEIVVSDNGIGFEQEYADQIFQIFERLHSIEDYEGTGVGLALCKKIVENHSGNIFAVSTEGNGAAFHILLPVKQ